MVAVTSLADSRIDRADQLEQLRRLIDPPEDQDLDEHAGEATTAIGRRVLPAHGLSLLQRAG